MIFGKPFKGRKGLFKRHVKAAKHLFKRLPLKCLQKTIQGLELGFQMPLNTFEGTAKGQTQGLLTP